MDLYFMMAFTLVLLCPS